MTRISTRVSVISAAPSRDLVHALDQLVHARQIAGTDRIAHLAWACTTFGAMPPASSSA